MPKIFICSNINQLISFHFSKFNSDNDDKIHVYIINKSIKNNEYINQIKNYCSKFNFQLNHDLDISKFQVVDLISRRDLNLDEINFIKDLK